MCNCQSTKTNEYLVSPWCHLVEVSWSFNECAKCSIVLTVSYFPKSFPNCFWMCLIQWENVHDTIEWNLQFSQRHCQFRCIEEISLRVNSNCFYATFPCSFGIMNDNIDAKSLSQCFGVNERVPNAITASSNASEWFNSNVDINIKSRSMWCCLCIVTCNFVRYFWPKPMKRELLNGFG